MALQTDADFGFSAFEAVTEDNSVAEAAEQIATLTELVETQKTANRTMFRRISALLVNLKKNPEKPNIHWPDREAKIDQFIQELSEYKI